MAVLYRSGGPARDRGLGRTFSRQPPVCGAERLRVRRLGDIGRIDLDDFSRARVSQIIANAMQQVSALVLVLDEAASITLDDMQRSQREHGDVTF